MSKKIKAHNILSDENFTIDSLSDKKENEVDKQEIQIARIIYTYLVSKESTSKDDEKEQTKKRIKQSIQKIRQKNRYKMTQWAVAASILVAVLSGVLFRNNLKTATEITEFTEALDNVKTDSVINLFLQDGRKVLISQKESAIAYDKKGENIIIDSTQKVSQQVVPEKQIYNTLVVPYGKRTQITLSDGSKIWLNSGSKLVYPANIKEKRKVYLEGEAIFEVTHLKNYPFLVVTKDFEVKVLGTVFNVSAYPEDKDSYTVLERGKVELTSIEKSFLKKEKLTIQPGTMAAFDSEKKIFRQQQVDANSYMSWRDGYFIFKKEPLSHILKKLERYYNIEIVLQSKTLEEDEFSGNLNLRNTPEEVLKIISETTPIIVRKESTKLIINEKDY